MEADRKHQDHWKPPEAGSEARKGPPQSHRREYFSVNTLILNFRPLELGKNIFLLFYTPSLPVCDNGHKV